MRATDFVECRKYAEKWWPGLEWALDEDVVRKFDRIPASVGRVAVDRLAETSPDRRPSVASFLKACRDEWRAAPRTPDTPDTCRHVWGVLSEWEQRQERERQGKPDSVRLSVCVLCRMEDWSARATVGESVSEGVKGEAA